MLPSMPSNASIAVVIATHDRPKYLDQCLASIAVQSEMPAQVIVIDDGSACDLSEINRRFERQLPLLWLRQPHGGVARARNHAASFVDAQWLCIMDDDDLMLPD